MPAPPSNFDTIWTQLEAKASSLQEKTIPELMQTDNTRFQDFSCKHQDLVFDFSREALDLEALELLLELAKASSLSQKFEAMLQGQAINSTENNRVLHLALRGSIEQPLEVGGKNVQQEIAQSLEKFLNFAENLRQGHFRGATGKPITDVANIGIGGSDLGPMLATQALKEWHDGPRVHFVSNIDVSHLGDCLDALDPESTLLIACSKTFRTQETLENLNTAMAWLKAKLGKAAYKQLAAATTNTPEAEKLGIPLEQIFPFWSFVGGRYSLWSSVGLSIAIAIGKTAFLEMLEGAKAMDRHFLQAPYHKNIPVLFALIGIWRRNFQKLPTTCLIAYEQRLANFAAYMQQLDMESNGKRVSLLGENLAYSTAPVIWGGAATNTQHSFFQALHQGTDRVSVDFFLAAQPSFRNYANISKQASEHHHNLLMSNALAQIEAFCYGQSQAEVLKNLQEKGLAPEEVARLAPHMVIPGSKPVSLFLFKRLNPETFGRLIALYEHKVFIQGAIWDINSFDQWGVELGKQIAKTIHAQIDNSALPSEANHHLRATLQHIYSLKNLP